ncbi:hypothetical protein C8Q74DRAFT_1231955 [Fomes fomentarius]|nr:hypothetical protein C8Q74DRAFT_1231955 [Fomes fomentarius]
MSSTSRTPFDSRTPDRYTFHSGESSPQAIFFPAPSGSSTNRARTWLSAANVVGNRMRELVERNTGLLLVASSQLFFSLMNVGVKVLNNLDPPVSAVELILVRMGITWICCVIYMYLMSVPDPILGPKEVRFFLVQRGVFGFVGIFGLYYSLQYLSVTDATVLQFLSPMFTAVAGAVFLHEAFSWREASAGLASLLGVLLIARPAFLFGSASHRIPIPHDVAEIARAVDEVAGGRIITSAQRMVAVGVALFGAVGAAGAYTTIRHIGKRAHPLHNLVAYSTLCVVVTTITMIVLRIPVVIPTRWDWLLLLLLIGIFGFGGQVLLTLGLQRETAGRGTIAVYGQIVFATILQRIFLHIMPSPLSVVGTVIIIGSALYVALTKKPHNRAADGDAEVEEGLLNNSEEDTIELAPPNHPDTPTAVKPAGELPY